MSSDKTYTIELTGPGSKLDAFLEAIDPPPSWKPCSTGASGIGRGDRIMKVELPRKGNDMKVYYDKDADLSLIKGRRSPSSAMARRAMPTPTT
jgi:hypothetical protein